jgi:RNA polymerase sigma-70 factor (ECF subfamily)
MPADAADLFARYARSVYRYFHQMTGRPDLAEDLTQQVFLRIVRSLPRYEARGCEAGWVFRIAENVLRTERPIGRIRASARARCARLAACSALTLSRPAS